jgi:hypothetical protein
MLFFCSIYRIFSDLDLCNYPNPLLINRSCGRAPSFPCSADLSIMISNKTNNSFDSQNLVFETGPVDARLFFLVPRRPALLAARHPPLSIHRHLRQLLPFTPGLCGFCRTRFQHERIYERVRLPLCVLAAAGPLTRGENAAAGGPLSV